MAKKKESKVITIPAPNYEVMKVRIVGDTPIKIHRLGKKMMQEFEDRDHNRPKPKKAERDYPAEFIDSLYFIDANGFEVAPPKAVKKNTRIGFPSSGFKKAMVSAARQFDNIKMTEIRGRFFVNKEVPFVEIKGNPKLDKFWRRIGGKGPGTGTPDIGIRAIIFPWSAELTIKFLKNTISAESILNLLSVAGFSVGVGEERPDKSGDTGGLFHIANSKS